MKKDKRETLKKIKIHTRTAVSIHSDILGARGERGRSSFVNLIAKELDCVYILPFPVYMMIYIYSDTQLEHNTNSISKVGSEHIK